MTPLERGYASALAAVCIWALVPVGTRFFVLRVDPYVFNVIRFAASGCGVKKTTTAINPSYSRAPTCDDAITTYASRADVPYDYFEVSIAGEASTAACS